MFDKVIKMFVNPNTKMDHVSLLIPTNGIALIIKGLLCLSCIHDIKKDGQKPSIHT